MKDFKGKVAVITGAASGIGFALSEKFATKGMKIVIADIDEKALDKAAERLSAKGAAVLPSVTDVSKADDVSELAKKTIKTYGSVHVLCNNAGVMRGGLSWEAPLEDYSWHLSVNLWGVIHGIRSFIPIMIEQDVESHVVNTSSMSGLTCTPYTAAYCLSKHAVVALSECIYHELTLSGSKIKVSVLLPTSVDTNINSSERNRPDRFKPRYSQNSNFADLVKAGATEAFKQGLAPEVVAEQVVKAIREERFYIFTEGGDSYRWRNVIKNRLDDLNAFRNPTFPVPEDMTSLLTSTSSENLNST